MEGGYSNCARILLSWDNLLLKLLIFSVGGEGYYDMYYASNLISIKLINSLNQSHLCLADPVEFQEAIDSSITLAPPLW